MHHPARSNADHRDQDPPVAYYPLKDVATYLSRSPTITLTLTLTLTLLLTLTNPNPNTNPGPDHGPSGPEAWKRLRAPQGPGPSEAKILEDRKFSH